MIATISNKISLALLKSNAINQDELNVYAYGIQLLILSVIDWCITFLFMLLIGEIYLSVAYLSVFFILRRHCGGYHAKTHMRCIVISNTVYIFSVLISANMHYENFIILLFIGEIMNFVMIHKFSPAEHTNKPIQISELARHKKIGRFLNVIISAIAIGTVLYGLKNYACVILMGQLSVSIAVVLQKIRTAEERRRSQMKKLKFIAQSLLCASAMLIATNSIGTMCLGRYYQPEAPKELERFANKKSENVIK